jgi:RNA polymerase sigma-70 factor (ECF subfamily)
VEDQFLINQVLAGNKNAYKLLVIRYQRPLFSFFKKFGFAPQKIEENAQEVFLKVYQHLSSFQKEKGSFSSWLFSMAKHLALNELKKKSEILEDNNILEQLAFDNSIESLDLMIGQKITNEKVNDLVKKIPSPFKIPVILSYIEELSIDEIAIIEKCSIGTVKSRIHRGKLALRQLILNERLV